MSLSIRRSISGTATALVMVAVALTTPATARAADPVTGDHVALAVGRLDSIVADAMTRSGVPGVAVAVVQGSDVLYAKGFGVRDVDTGAPVDASTVFQIASLSKTIAASVVAAAAGRGIVHWDDPVREHLPWFTLSDPYVGKTATIGDMFAMRSGLPGEAGDLLELIGFDRTQIIQRLRYLPLTPFRNSYAYANYSLTTGAQATAAAAKKPWADLAQQLIYEPLGMNATSSRYANFLAQPNRSALHVPVGGMWQSLYTRQPDAQAPAGGVSSNVLDLATWMRMELANGSYQGRQVVDASTLAEANTAQNRRTPAGDPAMLPQFYGFGMNVFVDGTGRTELNHSGAFTAGAGTTITMLPGSGLGIVVLTNGMSGVSEAISLAFIDLAESGSISRDWLALTGPVLMAPYQTDPEFSTANRPSSPVPARAATSLTGTYANGFYGTTTVKRVGRSLALVMGPGQVVLPLRHWSGGRYVATLSDVTWPVQFWVQFAGKGPQASGLVFGDPTDPTSLLSRVD